MPIAAKPCCDGCCPFNSFADKVKRFIAFRLMLALENGVFRSASRVKV